MKFTLPKHGNLLPKVEKPVKAFLHDAIGGYERRRPVHILHASDVTNESRSFCPREHSLLLETNAKPSRQYINTSLRHTFDMGNDLEARTQLNMGSIAVGDWECTRCEDRRVWERRPIKCGQCGGKKFLYLGSRFISEYSGISCGIDFIGLFPGEKKLRMVEIKTMVKDEFKKLKAPLAEHALRTKLYLRCAAESSDSRKDEINLGEASILYVCKGFGCKDEELLKMDTTDTFSPFKEFKVSRGDDLLAEESEKGRQYDQFRNGDAPICSGICASPMEKRAQSCPVVKDCFGGDYPAGEYWRSE